MLDITQTVDRLGILKANISPMEEEMKRLQQVLVNLGPDLYAGDFYSARVSFVARATLNPAIVKGLLSPAQYHRALQTSRFERVCISARLAQAA